MCPGRIMIIGVIFIIMGVLKRKAMVKVNESHEHMIIYM